ncbi:MAG: hypothetical protein ABSF94_21890 [Steroidobacteraceae bacterium]|jgi:hypothetical protein
MPSRFTSIIVAIVLASVGYAGCAFAIGPDPKPTSAANGYTNPLTGQDMEKMHDVTEQDRAAAKEQSAKLIAAMDLSCELVAAERVGRGKIQAEGKTTGVNVYEIACANGMGYLLEPQGSQKPIAVSCFAAEAMHSASAARGDKSDLYCQLAPNKDVKATAAALLTRAGEVCKLSDLRWFGLSASTQTEYSEVACTDGKGYLLKIPEIGISARISAINCQEAAMQGLKCRLTDPGSAPAPVALQIFRDALKSNGVDCEPTQMRLIGRETIDKRYVVEVQCPQQPKGLVAFIPLEGNTNKFETIDCGAAVEQEIVCKFTAQ